MPAPQPPAAGQPPGRGPAAFDAIVLAGGRASRLGGIDKPGLVVGAQTLIGSVLSAAGAAGAARVIVVGPAPHLAGQEIIVVREDPPGSGPVAALRRGLAEVTAPAAMLLAADLPFLRATHLELLTAALPAHGAPGVIMVDDGRQWQWLTSCWRTQPLLAALRGYRGGSLHGLLGPLSPVPLRYHRAAAEPPAWLDCDTPDDLRRARAWCGGGGEPGEHA